jgi:Uma2 family endonuclease
MAGALACARAAAVLDARGQVRPDEIEPMERSAHMATVSGQPKTRQVSYPTGDGKPMAETEIHRDDMIDLIHTLEDHFAGDPMICVSGNMLMFYEEGNRRKHVSPDVFAVRGVEKRRRENYLVWKEGKAPDVVIEITSKTTRREDEKTKWELYRDVLKVPEYFQFDPTEDYLKPSLQGFRLVAGQYLPIEPVEGRLPSQVLGLHLERDGKELRLYDPATGTRLLKRDEERDAAKRLAEAERQNAEAERARAQAAEAKQERLADEVEHLRREIDELRHVTDRE